MRRMSLVFVALVCVLGLTATPASAKAKLKLTSSAFESGGMIPEQYTCVGENTSPPLEWKGVPKKTRELALTMEDPDAPAGTFVHWVVFSIDKNTHEFPEGGVPEGAQQGANGTGSLTYFGPCPPAGPAHRYKFTLYALSKLVDLAAASSITDLRTEIKGKVKAKAKLVGRYGRALP